MPSLSLRREFERGIEKEFYGKANKIISHAAKAAWNKAVEATPAPPTPSGQDYKRTGRLRAGWKLNTGRRVGLIPSFGKYGPPSTPVFSFELGKDRAIQLYNNVPYASFVEEGAGNGHRVPRKMLFQATIVFDAYIRRGLP